MGLVSQGQAGQAGQVGPVALLIAVLGTALGAAQLLLPPSDGDIRTVYWELQNRTDVWLTLETRNAKGERAPVVTFTYSFPGKRQTAPPRDVEVRALAGQFWAPRSELRFQLDGGEVLNLSAPQANAALIEGSPDYWSGHVPIEAIRRMAHAQRITGSSLGFAFELSATQRQALRTWLERISLKE